MAQNPIPADQVPKTMLMIVSAFLGLQVLLCIFVLPTTLKAHEPAPTMAVVCLASAIIGALVAINKLRPKDASDSTKVFSAPGQFQVDMLIALAFFEFCGLLGIFVVADPVLSYVSIAVAVVGILVFVLPPTVTYCRVLNDSLGKK